MKTRSKTIFLNILMIMICWNLQKVKAQLVIGENMPPITDQESGTQLRHRRIEDHQGQQQAQKKYPPYYL